LPTTLVSEKIAGMYPESVRTQLTQELNEIREAGLYKDERVIVTPQGAAIRVQDGREVLNFCANNYLGLSSHPRLIEAAHKALEDHGYGMSSVRFICGTQDLHKELEAKVSEFLGHEDTILYIACWDANGGLFETILTAEDAVISDQLNHASIIDGVRLCKAARYRYLNADMNDLEAKLKEAREKGARRVLIATDGVFSMDGTVTRRPSSARPGAAPPSTTACRAASTSPRRRSAKRWAVRPAASPRRRRRSSTCSATARGRTCSPTPCRRRSPPLRSRRSRWSPSPATS
jgi:hypothetical protein